MAASAKFQGKVKLITPSWVIPGTYLENLRFLDGKDKIDGVELLFFLYDEDIRAEFLRDLPGIRDFAKRFVFTAHLPDNLREEHEELVEVLSPLVKHFIVHPAADADAGARLLETWMSRYGRRRFLLENTVPGRFEALLACFGGDMPVCMDTAHLLIEGRVPADFARRYSGQIREVHLNGMGEGDSDGHKPPRAEDGWFLELVPFLRQFSGIVNLELFSWDEVKQGIDCLEKNV
ncbi:MAG: AP endonuclease [Spirochaetaceae bacterium]|jgi:hypothetical protein|nr:AP endonuclease [Spirochaetaceae bacterium]